MSPVILQEFLESHLPNLGMPEWARFLRRLLMKIGIKGKELQPLADQSINSLILGEQLPSDQTSLFPSTHREKETINNFLWALKTPEARDIWHTAGNDYQDNWHGRQWCFIASIVNFIQGAETSDQIGDSFSSLQKLEDSKEFKRLELHYSLTHDHQIKLVGSDGLSHDKHNGSELIQYLEMQLSEKTGQLRSEASSTTKNA